jgi:hypothetical protein
MYLVQPHGGELNYRLVDRSPEKFYDQVFNQEITQHKVKQVPSHRNQVEITTKITKRPYMKIMEKIRGKIAERLKSYFTPEEWDRVVDALSDKHIEHQILLLIRQDKIQLLDQHNEPVYSK